MPSSGKHVALVSQTFDPLLRDGASNSMLSRLRFLKEQGCRTSIFSFLITNTRYKLLFDNPLATPVDTQVIREGAACRGTLQGIPIYQEMLPFSWEQSLQERRPIVKTMMNHVQRQNVDYVLTLDEDYYPLLAAWLADIPGAHFFNCLLILEKFAANADYVRFLRDRVVLANSRFLQTRIGDFGGIDSVVWYPFIDLENYLVRRDAGRTNTIGFCSTQVKVKGNEIVDEIAKHLPDHSFLVVGGAYGRETSAFPENLTYRDHIPDMREFYKQIDLLLVPSLTEESFGRVILEAAVNGIPVIANRVGGIPEALGDSGVLIDWDRSQEPDIAAIADQYVPVICRLLDDGALYQHLRRKALARATEYENEQAQMSRTIYQKYFC